MKKFILNLSAFVVVLILIIGTALFLPPTPKSSGSLVYTKIAKDSLLKSVPAPRMIFVGGSNLAFGLNSAIVKDSLHINPINAGIQASIGLLYMMNNTVKYVKRGDIIIVVPEYQQFYKKAAYGKEGLVQTIFDVDPESIKSIQLKQWQSMFTFILKHAFSKLNPTEYRPNQTKIYSTRAFNEYGDACAHWKLKKMNFEVYPPITGDFNLELMRELSSIESQLRSKGAVMYFSFPCYQASSFDRSVPQIRAVEIYLRENGFTLLGSPERYRMADSLTFDTPYHLVKTGVDIRTHLLIEDIKNVSLNSIQ